MCTDHDKTGDSNDEIIKAFTKNKAAQAYADKLDDENRFPQTNKDEDFDQELEYWVNEIPLNNS